jgi:hypothetical protein
VISAYIRSSAAQPFPFILWPILVCAVSIGRVGRVMTGMINYGLVYAILR